MLVVFPPLCVVSVIFTQHLKQDPYSKVQKSEHHQSIEWFIYEDYSFESSGLGCSATNSEADQSHGACARHMCASQHEEFHAVTLSLSQTV